MASTNEDDVVLLHSLEDLCLLKVMKYLSLANVWFFHRLVPYVHCPRIEHIVHSFICDNFVDISHTDQFLALDEKEMQWFLDNQDIKVSEAAMLDSLARWYKHKKKQRGNAFKHLFDKLHLNVISKDLLWALIKKYKLVKVIPELRDNKSENTMKKKLFHQSLNIDDLVRQENIAVLICAGSVEPWTGNWTYYLSLINLKETETTLLCDHTPLKTESGEFRPRLVLPLSSCVYLMDVCIRNCRETMICCDMTTGFVTKCASIPKPRNLGDPCILAAAPCGIFIFVLICTDIIINNYRYDAIKDEWKEMRPMNQLYRVSTISRPKAISASFRNEYLFVFGRHGGAKYNVYTNTWREVSTPWFSLPWLAANTNEVLNEDIDNSHCTSTNDKVLVIVPHKRHLFIYTPHCDTWKSVEFKSDVPRGVSIYNFTAQDLNGRLYLLYQLEDLRLYLSVLSGLKKERKLFQDKEPRSFVSKYPLNLISLTRLGRSTAGSSV